MAVPKAHTRAESPPPSVTKGERDGLGAVFTKSWVAELVLDVAGYTADRDLTAGRAIEPSCGTGAFLLPMIDRLAASCVIHERPLRDTARCIRAWDLDSDTVRAARAATRTKLRHHGLSASDAARLARNWIQEGDFLLADNLEPADWVVGNPPYVRLEEVSPTRSAAYRMRWDTMRGRADVYIGFIEAGIRLLGPDGVLAFICADRWMRNQYGKDLRHLIGEHFAVETVITMHNSDVFENRVSAYPAVFAIARATQGGALIVDADRDFSAPGATELSTLHRARSTAPATSHGQGFSAALLPRWFVGTQSWPTGSADQLALVAELEDRHPRLGDPESHTRLGIGLATGADNVFLTTDSGLVESDRLMPMVMAADLHDGKVVWSGTHLVSPWTPAGELVNLDAHESLSEYYLKNASRLMSRHVATRQPARWYRTIDKPVAGLAQAPKLLMPDLRMRVTPALEDQGLYPHHNLFWVTAKPEHLGVLGGLLLSDFGTLFVETYSPRMAGGALRVTAQYLKRICLPNLDAMSTDLQQRLATAFDKRDIQAATHAAAEAYGISNDRLPNTR